jgi:hypothetical protein
MSDLLGLFKKLSSTLSLFNIVFLEIVIIIYIFLIDIVNLIINTIEKKYNKTIAIIIILLQLSIRSTL